MAEPLSDLSVKRDERKCNSAGNIINKDIVLKKKDKENVNLVCLLTYKEDRHRSKLFLCNIYF